MKDGCLEHTFTTSYFYRFGGQELCEFRTLRQFSLGDLFGHRRLISTSLTTSSTQMTPFWNQVRVKPNLDRACGCISTTNKANSQCQAVYGLHIAHPLLIYSRVFFLPPSLASSLSLSLVGYCNKLFVSADPHPDLMPYRRRSHCGEP